jgi:polysaccharide biosynthesis protein PslA
MAITLPINRSDIGARNDARYSPAIVAGLVVSADVLAILLSGNIAFLLSGWILPVHYANYGNIAFLLSAWISPVHYANYLSVSILAAGVVVGMFRYLKLYKFDALVNPMHQLRKIIVACGLSFFILYLAMLAFSAYYFYAVTWRYSFVLISIAAIYMERWVVYRVLLALARRDLVSRNVVIIGGGQQGARLIRSLRESRQPWTRILGVFDDRLTRVSDIIEGCPRLGTTSDLIAFARDTRIDDVFIALPWSADARIHDIFEKVRVLPTNIHLSPNLAGFSFPRRSIVWRDGVCVLNIAERPLADWNLVIKTLEDKFVALLACIMLLPVLALAAVAIKLDSPGPILFRQKRYGFNNALIEVYKFRTMYHQEQDKDAERLTSKNDCRVTRVGRFLRRMSIDEIPQFFNVLEGSMSVVGPRPHAVKAKAGGKLYAEAIAKYAERHKIRPGITGWAQVNGWRGETHTEEMLRGRVECDIYYVENWSLLFDIRIILKTLVVIFYREGAY